MSHTKDATDSDDEFHDAVAEPTLSNKITEKEIDELVSKQNDMSLDDDTTATSTAKEAKPEGIDDMIDEDELRELEKDMSEEELMSNKESSDKMKLQGNDLFKDNRAEDAIKVYTEALRICPTKYSKERAILYGNRAAAKIKIESQKSAIDDCSKAIELWPEYVRALLRRAKLHEHEDKLEEALTDYKKIYELDPGQQEAREAMVRLPPIINERNERLKEEMLSKLKDLGNMILKPFGLSTSNFQMQQDPNTGGYSVNFSQNS